MGNLLSTPEVNNEITSLKESNSQLKKELEMVTGRLNAINATLEIVSLQLQATGAFPSVANLELQKIKLRMQDGPNTTLPITPSEYAIMKHYEKLLILQGYKLTEKQIEPNTRIQK